MRESLWGGCGRWRGWDLEQCKGGVAFFWLSFVSDCCDSSTPTPPPLPSWVTGFFFWSRPDSLTLVFATALSPLLFLPSSLLKSWLFISLDLEDHVLVYKVTVFPGSSSLFPWREEWGIIWERPELPEKVSKRLWLRGKFCRIGDTQQFLSHIFQAVVTTF